MCGFSGVIGTSRMDADTLYAMAAALHHRGPDERNIWLDPNGLIGFAHTRLAILDLSEAGSQPMVSPCGQFILVYNGEIYNHAELRSELEREGGHFNWRGRSDTETLLASLRHWGIQKALQKCNGMFAFALWDRNEATLYLARDRIGEKPLYYGFCGDTFLFGSELNSLRLHAKWSGSIDRDALTAYFRVGYVPSPRSIYSNISKLPAAHYVVVRQKDRDVSQPKRYWDLHEVACRNHDEPYKDFDEYVDELNMLLRDSVRRRMVADVPLGAFLSGGIDSSSVVALMQSQSARPIKTFSIGFYEHEYDEADHARAVASYLGTDHTELYLSAKETVAAVPKIAGIWDEPFADPSQIPTFLICELARRSVTVSLSGDGGDELFCGYNRYLLGYQAWKKMHVVPLAIRKIIGKLMKIAAGAPLGMALRRFPRSARVPRLEAQLTKLAGVLEETSDEGYYQGIVSQWHSPESLVIGGQEPPKVNDVLKAWSSFSDPRERMMYLDAMTYLPDDILTKTDRASMAVSLEARIPLLDHRVVEFAWTTPGSVKFRDKRGKFLLRRILQRYVPSELIERPKMGFGVPIGQWLRGPLKEWAEDLLSWTSIDRDRYIDAAAVQLKWREHITKRKNWGHELWVVLMFQAWLKHTSQSF